MARTLKNSRINPGNDYLSDEGGATERAVARKHALDLAQEADSDGSEAADRAAAKAALRRGLGK